MFIYRVGFEKPVPWTHNEIWKFARKEMGTPDVNIDTKFNKANWDKGIRNIPYHIHVHLPRKPNGDEESPNKLYLLIACVPVIAFRN